MKTLKVKDKLMVGIFGQLIFITLLLFFVFSLNVKLSRVTKNRIATTQEVNSIKELSLLTKDFFGNRIDFNTLEKAYKKAYLSDDKNGRNESIKEIWDKILRVKVNNDSNILAEQKLMELTAFSIEQSNAFLNGISQRLANESTQHSVTKIERMVIAGANDNNNNNHTIRLLFQKLKEDIKNKDELLSFLEKAIEQASIDIKLLQNTQFAQLPVKATEANLKIRDLAGKFISNVEENDILGKEIFTLTDQLFQQVNETDIQSTRESFSSLKVSIATIFIILLLISIALIILNLILTKIIAIVFKKLPEDMIALSEGDLTREVSREFELRGDEVGDLAKAYNKMVDNLKKIITDIKQGATNIASASEQLTSTSELLSKGASEQASSTEEVSSTMEQMASNISQNTDNAQQTEKISLSAQKSINEVYKQASQAMEANKVIANKISIITDIAFQTNLLALNAAVEAARAGEHGKGFAVVAAEVRKLAERSKVAADEIIVLAKNSLNLSEGAGNRMSEMIPEINKTTKLVQEIAAASIEQNNGSVQINSALQQLNEITQQNASASEEMASSAQELATQAEALNTSVAYFKFDMTEVIEGPKAIRGRTMNRLEIQ